MQRSPVVRTARLIDAAVGLPGFLLVMVLRYFMSRHAGEER